MEKENQRVRLTKLLLKEKLEQALMEKPINRVTVKEICQAADINRSTFYQHYADQYELLGEIESDIILKTGEFISKIGSENSGLQYLVKLMAYIRENGAILSILLSPQANTTFQNRFMAMVLTRLRSIDRAVFNSALMPYFSQFLVMGDISVIQQWIKNDFDLPDEKVAEIIYVLSDNAVKVFAGIGE